MKSWSETINLTTPLRDARLAGAHAVMTPGDGSRQDEWQSSFELGRIEGEKALSQQLVQQRKELHELVGGVLKSLREAVPQVIRESESLVVALALEVAQKIIAEMPVSVPLIEAAVRDALTQVEGTEQLTIRLHPADLELLQSAGADILKEASAANEFRFLSSPEVTRGGCIVQTRFGTVDARRETKFDLLKSNLLS